MAHRLKDLVKQAPQMSPQERAAQRESFAYGNVHLENDRVTRAVVAQVAAEIAPSSSKR